SSASARCWRANRSSASSIATRSGTAAGRAPSSTSCAARARSRSDALGPRLSAVAGPWPGAAAACPRGRRDDLAPRVHQAGHMARRAVDAADAPGSSQGGAPREQRGPAPLQLAKVVGESAMLVRGVDFLGAGDAGLREALDALAARLAPLARGEAVAARLC